MLSLSSLNINLYNALMSGASGYALSLDLLSGTLDNRVTFTRGSNATLVDSTGKITYAPANLVLRSDDFDNAGSWTKNATTVTSNSTTAPDGTSTADTLTATATTAVHNVQQVAGGAGVTLVWSVYAKAGTNSFIQLWHGISVQTYANFNLSTGAVGTVGTDATASITSVGNGWYRCSIRFTTAALGTLRVALVTSATAAYNESWAAAGTESAFIWGAQLEPVTYQTTTGPYVATTTAAYYGPRFDYDPVTLAAKGLLIEEQRVNLLLRSAEIDNAAWNKSNATVTANTTVAPDGTSTADTVTASATLGLHLATQAITVTNATVYTASFFVKAAGYSKVGIREGNFTGAYATFNLATGTKLDQGTGGVGTITAVGNGWYRIDMVSTSGGASFRADISILDPTYTTGAPTGTWTADGTSGIYVWGAQVEAGAFPTSYIPTVASQVTRTADVASMTGTNFSSWYNQSEGTFVSTILAGPASLTDSQTALYVTDATAINLINIRRNTASNVASLMITSGGSGAGLIPVSPVTSNTIYKNATAYALNNANAATNSTLATLDIAVSTPLVDRLFIGVNSVGTAACNGHIRSIQYYNTRLSDAQLQTLTQPDATLSLNFISSIYEV